MGKGRVGTVIIDATDTDFVVLAAYVTHKIQGILGRRMSLSIPLATHFDRASIYYLFYNLMFTQTQHI